MQRLDLVPLQERRPTRRLARPKRAHEHAVNLGPAAALAREVGVSVVVVDSARAPHRVVRGAGRLAVARGEVAVDGADAALVLVDDAQLAHVGRPHLAVAHVLDLEPDAVQRREEARQAREDGADREEG